MKLPNGITMKFLHNIYGLSELGTGVEYLQRDPKSIHRWTTY